MSLKTSLSALCDCFVTKIGFNSLFDTRLSAQKVFVSNQSMPSSTVTDFVYTTPTDQHFTAPSDGYLTLVSAIGEGNWAYCVIWQDIESASYAEGATTAAYVPMRKGQTVYFSVAAIKVVKFVSTIGEV